MFSSWSAAGESVVPQRLGSAVRRLLRFGSHIAKNMLWRSSATDLQRSPSLQGAGGRRQETPPDRTGGRSKNASPPPEAVSLARLAAWHEPLPASRNDPAATGTNSQA